jgi:YD repeat-containing protein
VRQPGSFDDAYWGDGQLRAVREGTTVLADYAYDAGGRLATLTRSNGAVTTATYDNAHRLTDLHTTVGGQTAAQFRYTLDRLGLRLGVTETLSGTVRSITYTYDGLLRLTSAVEDPGTTYAYAYDLAGNRTEVWENGVQTQSHQYNAANQVIGWSYDAAGNLLSDGTHTSSYDALSRQVSRDGTTYASNGDSGLVQAGATAYTLDLAAPLSQVLHDGTSDYVYGNGAERLRAAGGAWYIPDALGSVRATLDGAGTVLATTSYDP